MDPSEIKVKDLKSRSRSTPQRFPINKPMPAQPIHRPSTYRTNSATKAEQGVARSPMNKRAQKLGTRKGGAGVTLRLLPAHWAQWFITKWMQRRLRPSWMLCMMDYAIGSGIWRRNASIRKSGLSHGGRLCLLRCYDEMIWGRGVVHSRGSSNMEALSY